MAQRLVRAGFNYCSARKAPAVIAGGDRPHGEDARVLKTSGKRYRIGYTCGVFDLFHVGHLNLLERCKAMCDYLIVGVCDDEYVRDVKRKEPVIPEGQRVRVLNALEVVDRAELVDVATTDDKMLALGRFGFDVLFSGDDWKGSERYRRTEEQFAKVGVSIEYLPYTCGVSTSMLKEAIARLSGLGGGAASSA